MLCAVVLMKRGSPTQPQVAIFVSDGRYKLGKGKVCFGSLFKCDSPDYVTDSFDAYKVANVAMKM